MFEIGDNAQYQVGDRIRLRPTVFIGGYSHQRPYSRGEHKEGMVIGVEKDRLEIILCSHQYRPHGGFFFRETHLKANDLESISPHSEFAEEETMVRRLVRRGYAPVFEQRNLYSQIVADELSIMNQEHKRNRKQRPGIFRKPGRKFR